MRADSSTKVLGILTIIALVGVSLSCSSGDPAGIAGPSEFSFRIVAVDSTGEPVPGLRVCVWSPLPVWSSAADCPAAKPGVDVPSATARREAGSRLSPSLFEWGLSQNYPNPFSSTTLVVYQTAAACRARITLLEADRSIFRQLLDSELDAGACGYIAFGDDCADLTGGTRAFRCEFSATNAVSGDTLFSKEVLALLHRPGELAAAIGMTGADGAFETRERLLFPHLFELPPVVRTGPDSPTPLGETIITDAVAIALVDSIGGHQIAAVFERIVSDDTNDFTLIWNPDLRLVEYQTQLSFK